MAYYQLKGHGRGSQGHDFRVQLPRSLEKRISMENVEVEGNKKKYYKVMIN